MTSAAKSALDKIINKGRIHLYKPIQIAEILHHSRIYNDIDIGNIASYRNKSKIWRDVVSRQLVGNVSTSSQKFQDNLFDENAITPPQLQALDVINKKGVGIVENYIYHRCKERWGLLSDISNYISSATTETFALDSMIGCFTEEKGLKRSIDKLYEIAVYALFSTIVKELNAIITLEIKNPEQNIVTDFQGFINLIFGMKDKLAITAPAKLYRAGVTNAADTGVDIWTNFGPFIQVKHLTLDKELIGDITEGLIAESVIIVCLDAEKDAINSILSQIGWGKKIQGIITLNDLRHWYEICLHKYTLNMGKDLLNHLKSEFDREFPLVNKTDPFLKERGYDQSKLSGEWELPKHCAVPRTFSLQDYMKSKMKTDP